MGWCECHDIHIGEIEMNNCPVCDNILQYAIGIGPFCASKDCPVLDDALLWRNKNE